MKKNVYDLLNKYNLKKNTIMKIGHLILNNKLILKYNYLPKSLNNIDSQLNFSPDFNWVINLGNYSNMAMLHLHAWEPINYLFLAHYHSKELKYIEKAVDLIKSWEISSHGENHKYLWYPHCVADRSIVLGYLKIINNENEIINSNFLNELINQHIVYLIAPNNYVNYNHGAMMDRSLILLSILTRNNKLLELAIERTRTNFSKTFTENMICVENSITYSIYNIELIISIQKNLLDIVNEHLVQDFDKKMIQALDFINILKQPNDSFPLYGDGELITLSTLKNKNIYKYYSNHSVFSTYNTKKLEHHYFIDEGYIIIKDENKYFFIRSGGFVKNHKHPDDLSFVLYYNEEILIDTGIYNYDNGEIKNYFKSSQAHNSIVLENETYPYLQNKEDIGISLFKEYSEYYYIVIKNNSYQYANILRHIYIIKGSFSILISDNIKTPLKIKNSQFFNLSPKLSNELFISVNREKTIINNNMLIQSIDIDSLNLKTASSKKALLSEKYHDLKYISQLELIKNEANARLTTLISFDIQSDILKTLQYNDQSIFFSDLRKNYQLEFRNNIEEVYLDKYIHLENIKKRVYSIKTFYRGLEEKDFAWYIYRNQNRIDIIWYQDSPKFTYDFKEPGDYKIRCFIRNKRNKDEKHEFSIKKILN